MRFAFCTVFCLGILASGSAQPENNFAVEARKLASVLVRNHHQPKNVDDQFSRDLFDFFIECINAKLAYLTAQQVDGLGQYQDSLDDQMKLGPWTIRACPYVALPVFTPADKVKSTFTRCRIGQSEGARGDKCRFNARKRSRSTDCGQQDVIA